MKPMISPGLFLLLALPLVAVAQRVQPVEPGTRSFSGQFVVFAPPPHPLPPALEEFARSPVYIHLQPTLLAVSCERLKQTLGRELGLTEFPEGKVILRIRHGLVPDALITVVSHRARGDWSYHLELPEVIRRDQFVRVIVQVLLADIANRGAQGDSSADIPAWLAEGLAQHIQSTSGRDLLLAPPSGFEGYLALTRRDHIEVRTNLLVEAQEILRRHPPLTFQQLSWPTEAQWSGVEAAIYRGNAHIFVRQLLAMKDGPARIRALIEQLPRRHNWQLAFLDSFQPAFSVLLDVEKWWAVQILNFSGRDLNRTWTFEDRARQLDETLRAPVQIRTSSNELPQSGAVTLQTVIGEWNAVQQANALKRKLRDLDLLRINVAPGMLSLVDDYRSTLAGYIEKRKFGGPVLPRRSRLSNDRVAVETIRQLDALDARRASLTAPMPEPISAAVSAAQ